ncbi:carbohydrate kinase family protein [Candidatus Wolfebacteria bacterium]|nr:carbohydrate kinase family protein [Candidatus Wolfebacteria bacterium]
MSFLRKQESAGFPACRQADQVRNGRKAMYDIVTIGTASRDVFLKSKAFRPIKDAEHLKKLGFTTGEAQCFPLGGKVELDNVVFRTGGGALNAATTFARQGLKTGAVVKIGNDSGGDAVVTDLKKERVHSFAVRDRQGTAYSLVFHLKAGERTILVFRGASEDLRSNEVPATAINTRWVYIVPGTLPYGALAAIFNRFDRARIHIAFAPSKHFIRMGIKRLAPILRRSSVVLMNREEGAMLTGLDFRKESAIFKELDALVYGIAVLTDGPRGVIVSDGERIYAAKTFREKNLLDRTGSGDAFGSGFVASLARRTLQSENGTWLKEDIMEAIRLGSANATSVVEHIGAQEGILTRRQFGREDRWGKLPIKVRRL